MSLTQKDLKQIQSLLIQQKQEVIEGLQLDQKLEKLTLEFDKKLEKQTLKFDKKFEEQTLQFDRKFEKQTLQVDEKFEKQSLQFDKKFEKQSLQFDEKFEKQTLQVNEKFEEQSLQLDKKLNKQRKEIIIDIFQNFATKNDVEKIVEKKLVPIKIQLTSMQEIILRFDYFLNTEFRLFDKFGVESRRRIIRLENKVGVEDEELPRI